MDIKEVKEEIKKEEELLIKVFQLEKFIKKYKTPIIVIFAILVIGFISYNAYDYYKKQQLIAANNALDTVIQNPNNKKALEELKQNKKLYDLYLLQKGELNKITTPELQEIKAYKLAMQKGDIISLEEYLNNPNYHILKNGVRIALIRLYLQKGDRKKAIFYANQIPLTSKYKEIANYLIHYGIVK